MTLSLRRRKGFLCGRRLDERLLTGTPGVAEIGHRGEMSLEGELEIERRTLSAAGCRSLALMRMRPISGCRPHSFPGLKLCFLRRSALPVLMVAAEIAGDQV